VKSRATGCFCEGDGAVVDGGDFPEDDEAEVGFPGLCDLLLVLGYDGGGESIP
jgi:hypothetical protein